ncbi:MAG: VWA domain-containing protein [Phycisphaerae bacterium]
MFRSFTTPSRRFGGRVSLFRRCVVLATLLGTLLAAAPAMAGSGAVNNNGTINVTVNFRFPPTAADLTNIQTQITAASLVLWDASEGQLRFGTVTLTCGAVNEDLADAWIFASTGRAGTTFWNDGSGVGRSGIHINLYQDSLTNTVIAHEFSHLALGLADEYSEQSRFGACWGYGQCIETANLTEQNQCLMQQPSGFTQTEYCTTGGHDTVTGEGTPCTTGAAPCTTNCGFYNPGTGQYETSQQTDMSGMACWPKLVANYSFLAAPAALPTAAAPGGLTNPTYVDNCGATDTVLLVLDRSGSMNWNTESDGGEVCGNGVDDDGDGSVDEAGDCTQTRLAFLQAAARAWLELASGQGVRAGIVSFNELASLDAAFQDVNAGTLAGLEANVGALSAGGNTAIGRALTSSTLLFGAEVGALNKTAFLISDGVNTAGETPQSVVPDLQAQGIRVFTISTGGASDDSTLSNISGETSGARVDSRDAATLVGAFVQQWARYRNTGILIPLLPYSVNQRAKSRDDASQSEARDPSGWGAGFDVLNPLPAPDLSPNDMAFSVIFEDGTHTGTLVLAGDMGDMSGFGVEVALDGPAGPGPILFDSTVPDPKMRVVRDSFFLLVEITDPNPGTWRIRVRGTPGMAQIQTGNISVISDNPRVDLFTDLDRQIVSDPTKAVELTVTPIYDTALHNVDQIAAVVQRPDGSIVSVPLASGFDTGGGEGYTGKITDMPFYGMYEVRIFVGTGANTINDPGEAVFANDPSKSVAVPTLERTAVEYFFVTKGQHVCRSGDPKDCDGDGCFGESLTEDHDKDGVPDAYDGDSDNDEVSDRLECQGRDFDADQDGVPNQFDPDSDGDGINDGSDNCRLFGNPDQRDSDGDGVGDTCDNCPDKFNDGQADADQDHFGDACDDRPNDEFGHGPNDGPFLPPVFPICGGGFFLAAVALGLTMTGLTLFGVGWMSVRRRRCRRR